MPKSADECAVELLEVVPQVMRAIRAEMRRHTGPDLSVPHFRVLTYLNRRAGASLSEVAEHIGLALPSMSHLIDGLVARRLVTRRSSRSDRRRITLMLTARGQTLLAAARRDTQARLAELLASLSPEQQDMVAQAFQVLRPVFIPEGEAKSRSTR